MKKRGFEIGQTVHVVGFIPKEINRSCKCCVDGTVTIGTHKITCPECLGTCVHTVIRRLCVYMGPTKIESIFTMRNLILYGTSTLGTKKLEYLFDSKQSALNHMLEQNEMELTTL